MKPGTYFIACQLNPVHRVLDLPSQEAHRESGLVQAITGNGSEYQKWLIEAVQGEEELFTIRSSVLGSKFIEPLRSSRGGDQTADEILLGFYPRTDSPFQRWRFEPAQSPGVFSIRNEGSGKYWDLREQDPSHVQQLYRKDMPHQRWIIRPAG